MHTPPRSPGGDKYLGRTLSPKTSGSLFDIRDSKSSLHDSEPDFNISKEKGQDSTHDDTRGSPFNERFARTDGAALANAFKMGG